MSPIDYPHINSLPSHVWPAVPDSRAGHIAGLLLQLENTQWLSSDELWERQTRQLDSTLKHALRKVPYYRERADQYDFDVTSSACRDQWQQLPTLSRETIQIAGEQMCSTAPPGEHGPVTSQITSGSTGKPVRVVQTGLRQLFWEALTLRDHLWHRRDISTQLVAIRATSSGRGQPPHGEQHSNWGTATQGIWHTGPAALLSVQATIAEQIRWLVQQQPGYLLTYPSNLAALLQAWPPEICRSLREVRTFGEVVDASLRRQCCEVLGVHLVDMYSCQEMGYLALQCPQHEHYHVQSESVLLEVLDDAGCPAGPGEIGRVVVTDLHNLAMPLIRYEIGDYAEVGEPCPCGRGLPVLRRIMGRRRNMFVLPNGQLRWPALELDNSLRPQQLPPVRQFQVIQRSLDEVEAVIAAYRPLTSDEERHLTAWFYQSLGCDQFRVRFTYVDQIAPHPNGKYEDFRSDVASANTSRDVTP